jgi:putative chitinase
MPILSAEALRKIAPQANAVIVNDIVAPLNKWMPVYGVSTHLRVCHFLAQLAHESAGFKTMQEYASGAAYEGRADLGNTEPGDGKRFKGRGLIQLTGRANYVTFGKRIGVDLVSNPERAASPENAVRLACEYWNDRKLNALADRDDVNGITKKVNGGYNGLTDRKAYLARAKRLFAGPLPLDVAPSPKNKSPVPAPKTTGTIAGGAAATTAAKAAGLSWSAAISIGIGAIVAIAMVIVLVHILRKGSGQ